MKFILAGAVLAAAVTGAGAAQAPTLQSAIGTPNGFRISGSARVRYETLNGQPRVGLPESDEQFAVRTTLFAEYDAGVVRIGGEVWDSRAWLHNPGDALSANEINALELVQAYLAADLEAPFEAGSRVGVQVGRMTLNIGSRRLVAADDFRNTTNGYTGVRGDLRSASGLTATVFYVLPQVRLPEDRAGLIDQQIEWDRESFGQQLWGAIVARPGTLAGATAELGYVGFLERDAPGRPTRNRDLDSFSARLIRDPKPGQFDFEAEGIYQTGAIRVGNAAAAPEQDVDAWFVHTEAGYLFPGPAKLRLAVEYDRASGDGSGGDFGRFDTLFGMRRADLAPSGIYNAVGRANIETVGVRAEVAPSTRWDAFAAYRTMWLAEATDSFSTTGVRDPSGAAGSFAGHQIEGRVRYWVVQGFLRAELNALWLAKGRFLETAPNAPRTGDTHYLATSLTATF